MEKELDPVLGHFTPCQTTKKYLNEIPTSQTLKPDLSTTEEIKIESGEPIVFDGECSDDGRGCRSIGFETKLESNIGNFSFNRPAASTPAGIEPSFTDSLNTSRSGFHCGYVVQDQNQKQGNKFQTMNGLVFRGLQPKNSYEFVFGNNLSSGTQGGQSQAHTKSQPQAAPFTFVPQTNPPVAAFSFGGTDSAAPFPTFEVGTVNPNLIQNQIRPSSGTLGGISFSSKSTTDSSIFGKNLEFANNMISLNKATTLAPAAATLFSLPSPSPSTAAFTGFVPKLESSNDTSFSLEKHKLAASAASGAPFGFVNQNQDQAASSTACKPELLNAGFPRTQSNTFNSGFGSYSRSGTPEVRPLSKTASFSFGSQPNPPSFGSQANPTSFGGLTNSSFVVQSNQPSFGAQNNPTAISGATNTNYTGTAQSNSFPCFACGQPVALRGFNYGTQPQAVFGLQNNRTVTVPTFGQKPNPQQQPLFGQQSNEPNSVPPFRQQTSQGFGVVPGVQPAQEQQSSPKF